MILSAQGFVIVCSPTNSESLDPLQVLFPPGQGPLHALNSIQEALPSYHMPITISNIEDTNGKTDELLDRFS